MGEAAAATRLGGYEIQEGLARYELALVSVLVKGKPWPTGGKVPTGMRATGCGISVKYCAINYNHLKVSKT